jgi:enoyl-CoA hydratase/carnithine racemase
VSSSSTLFEIEPPLATLTFNRPDARNALTWEMYDALFDACNAVDGDARVRVFVVTGAGGAFAAGTDIQQFTQLTTAEDAVAYERRLDRIIDRLEAVQCATIAQVDGVAAGGGCAIALACDLCVCTPDARFGVPIARTLGNCLSAANYARLLELVGPSRLKDLLFTGRFLSADEAQAAGLVTRVSSASAIGHDVGELATLIAANAPLTIRATKEAVRRIHTHARLPHGALDDLVVGCYTSEDFRNAVAAFLRKEKPAFQGS